MSWTNGWASVVEDFCQQYPGRFRYLFEPRQTKPHALNAGIREAHGHIMAFVDDDVTVGLTWLQNLTASLRNREWAGDIVRVPLVLFPRLIMWTLRWTVAIKPSRRFSCKLSVWQLAGEILECYRQSRDTNSQCEAKLDPLGRASR